MLCKPNCNISGSFANSPKNQIGRKFREFFDQITATGYYEGTKYGDVYSRLDNNGRSKIYVYDPLEQELQKFVDSCQNESKYLVGLTAMGKTTLVRNFFRIADRDVKFEDGKIVIYISFYYADLSMEEPQSSVYREVTRYLTRVIKILVRNNPYLMQDEKSFFEDFYRFIETNKPTVLENEFLTPGSSLHDEALNQMSYEEISKKLTEISESDPLEYHSSMIKYILGKLGKATTVIIVFDDVESKEEKFHMPVIEAVRHLHSCFSASEYKNIRIKTLVTLRAYTFRCNIGRQSEARREYLEKDVILKKETVSLSKIFEKRFESYEEDIKSDGSLNLDSFLEAKQQMLIVERQLERVSGNLIYNLCNYNLVDAQKIYFEVLTNLEWISKNEEESQGAFHVNSANYRITTENVMYAIANGNARVYQSDESYIPNILLNDSNGTTLISLYIIQFLLKHNIDEVYGEKYIEGWELSEKILSLFSKSTDGRLRRAVFESEINDSIRYLYSKGVLFRSVYDVETAVENQIQRRYDSNYKLYLSPRGKCLFQLLSENAVLLELYRDDIYTDLPDNDKLTSEINARSIFFYLLHYVDECFSVEKQNIGGIIPLLDNYQEQVGKRFISGILLEGIYKNLCSYYQNKDDDFQELMKELKSILAKMDAYAEQIAELHDVRFHTSEYLRQHRTKQMHQGRN